MPISSTYFKLLSRSLVYTGVTRATKLCIMVGETKALSMAISKKDMKRRNSLLAYRITSPNASGQLF